MARNWNRVTPTSVSHAMELCIEYAKERDPKFSIDRLAEALGQNNKSVVYKWLSNGRLPGILIPIWELFCGIDLITRYFNQSRGKMTITIPSGRKASAREINELQISLNDAVGLLIKHYGGNADTDETIAALINGMESLAWHKANIEKVDQPEFDFSQEPTE